MKRTERSRRGPARGRRSGSLGGGRPPEVARNPKAGRRAARSAPAPRRPTATPFADAILETAFHQAFRVSAHGVPGADRQRRRALLKILRASGIAVRQLHLAAQRLQPARLSRFQRTLIERKLGPGALDQMHRRLSRAAERIRGLRPDAERSIGQDRSTEERAADVRRFYGRLASFVKEVEPDLRDLVQVRRLLVARPRLDRGEVTVVVAGFPNTGKSTLVAALSTAHPKIAPYPFTTEKVQVGHASLGADAVELVDTPGLLGRSGKTNPAEVETHVALGSAARIVVFLVDPTLTSGYSIEAQEALLHRLRSERPDLAFIEVETKADLTRRPVARLHVSAKTGLGLDALRTEIARRLRPASTGTKTETLRVGDEEYALGPAGRPPPRS